jgi:sec-independent protein translocase protein TatA
MSIWHWLIVLVIVLLVFGSGKITNIMGDTAKGIKAFKKGMKDDDDDDDRKSSSGVIEGKAAAKEKDREHVG